jgi:hypothetical protein
MTTDPLAIYLAGKISKNDWRVPLVGGGDGLNLDDTCCCPGADTPLPDEWPVLRRAIFGFHDYTGPYFLGCDHGCFHGDDDHGLAANNGTLVQHHCDPSRPDKIVRLCRGAIERSDVVFAWLDSPDAYGTVCELGYAAALGKQIWIAGPKHFRDMWFVYRLDTRDHVWPRRTPKAALRSALEVLHARSSAVAFDE